MNLEQETKYILKKYGISANKNLGQNFLINEEAVDKIIEGANICREDLVIEIGPGLGTLTKELLERAGKVIAVELDKRMIHILKDRFKLYDNFELINDDILKIDLKRIINESLSKNPNTEYDDRKSEDIKHIKIVANLPYYITTPIIMKLLEDKLNIDTITVMIQKEVADRLIAIPGEKNTGAITYGVYYYSESSKITEVKRDSFIPEPNVDSEVIQLKIRREPPVTVTDTQLMFKIIKCAFLQRRKTLVNALDSSGIFKNKDEIINILKANNIDEKIRGEALSMEEYAKITNSIL